MAELHVEFGRRHGKAGAWHFSIMAWQYGVLLQSCDATLNHDIVTPTRFGIDSSHLELRLSDNLYIEQILAGTPDLFLAMDKTSLLDGYILDVVWRRRFLITNAVVAKFDTGWRTGFCHAFLDLDDWRRSWERISFFS